MKELIVEEEEINCGGKCQIYTYSAVRLGCCGCEIGLIRLSQRARGTSGVKDGGVGLGR